MQKCSVDNRQRLGSYVHLVSLYLKDARAWIIS